MSNFTSQRRSYLKHKTRHNKQSHDNKQSTVEKFISYLFSGIKSRSKTTKVIVNISVDDIIALYYRQNGLCAIMNIPMTHRLGAIDAISVDQVVPGAGYTIDNIQLVCRFVNLGKKTNSNQQVIDFAFKMRNTIGLLNGSKCYLAGAIDFETKDGMVNWRNEISLILKNLGVRVYNPLIKPYWYPDDCKIDPKVYMQCADNGYQGHGTISRREVYDATKFLVDIDFRMANDCTFMIVNLPRTFTVGTIDELRVAINAGKPIFIVNKDKYPSTWLLGMFDSEDWDDIFFRDIDELARYLKRIDNNEVELDRKKWVSIAYFRNVKVK
jgi:hypothetical protein